MKSLLREPPIEAVGLPLSRLGYQLRLLATALILYTRVPLPLWFDYSAEYVHRASRYLPLVGILVGCAGAFVFLSSNLLWTEPVAVLLSIVATVLLTGGFHEDGFADFCDGFGGGWTKADVLRIMKDPAIGSFGAIGLALLLLLKYEAIKSVDSDWIPLALIAGHSMSRVSAISYMVNQPYVQELDKSKIGASTLGVTAPEICIAALIGFSPLLFFDPFLIASLLLSLAVSRWYLGWLFMRRLGGFTGDCLGAAQQISEVLIYLVIGVYR